MNRSPFLRGSLAALLVASAWCMLPGCGSGHPKTTRVTGTVTYRGKPVEGANVMFAGKAGRPAEAMTDASGHFVLTTFRESDGAIGGEHTVIISKYVTASNTAAKPAGGALATADDLRGPQQARPRQVIPLRYISPSQSPLHAKVTDGGENNFQFDLTD